MVSGTTQVVAVIGHPIAQVKSPDNFNRYFAEQHMDSVMIPVDIVPDAVAAYLNALRGWQNMTGVLVTVPHKQRAAALVDDLTPRARRLNAVNVIRKLADGRLQGDMTVPHKQRAAALVDDLTPRARRLNAVNVIRKLA
ncbi:shikimate dehydrogenase, partial [Klebsiella pneumoniae]